MPNARPVKAMLLSTAVLAASINVALASNECGPYALTVTCLPGAYGDGIDYTVAGPFTLNLNNGVVVNNPNADPNLGPDYGAGVYVGGPANISINMLPGAAASISGGYYGILAFTDDGSSGNILVNANGNISGGATGIYTVTGSGASGSMAINVGNNAVVSGADNAIAAYSQATSPAAPITITTAAGSNLLGGVGILVQDDGGGVVNITTDGDIGRGAATQHGVIAIVYNTGSATVNVNGNINSLNGGIFAGAGGSDGDIAINTGINSNINTNGATFFGAGIEAIQADDIFGNPSIGNINIVHNGHLVANNAYGIYASTSNTAGNGSIDISLNGSVDAGDTGLVLQNAGTGASTVSIGANGFLRSSNFGSYGLFASVETGAFTFTNAGTVSTLGTNSVALNIASNGGAITINNISNGNISSASDFTVMTNGGTTLVNNSGSIWGYVSLGSNNSQFNNNSGGIFNARNFFDNNANGFRDSEAVSISTINGIFNNLGSLRLATVLGAANVDQSNRYTPTGLTAVPLGNGVEQAHLTRVSLFNNASVISLQDRQTGGNTAVAGDVLVITSGVVAGTPGPTAGIFQSNGGALYLDTVLNAGGANSLSDILVVDSTSVGAGGASAVFIENANGLGAQTLGDGIKIIDVLTGASGSAFNAFSLGNTRLAAGAFEYQLFRSGIQNNDGDWYLRSSFRSAISSYAGVPSALTDYGNAMLSTLHDRVGESEISDGFASAAWARWINQGTDTTSSSFSDAHFNSHFSAVQLGWDLWQHEQNNNRWQAGLSLGYGSIKNHTNEADIETGTLRGNVLTFGTYGTWHAANNAYVDVVAQKNRYYNIAAQANDGDLLQTNAEGKLISFEAGYPFVISKNLSLEPQLQIVWQSVKIDAANDNFSRVSFADNQTLVGRLGARLVRDWTGTGTHTKAWVRGNIWHGFDDGKGLSISALNGSSPIAISGQLASTWAELGIGSTVNIGDSTSLFAEISYYRDIEGPDLRGYNSNFGLRWQW